MRMIQNRAHQSEIPFIRFMRRQQMFARLGNKIQRQTRIEIPRQFELRLQQIARIQIHQLAILSLRIRSVHQRQPFQPRPERVLQLPHAPRHPAQFSLIARKKTHDQIRLAKRIRAQNIGFTNTRRHGETFRLSEPRMKPCSCAYRRLGPLVLSRFHSLPRPASLPSHATASS